MRDSLSSSLSGITRSLSLFTSHTFPIRLEDLPNDMLLNILRFISNSILSSVTLLTNDCSFLSYYPHHQWFSPSFRGWDHLPRVKNNGVNERKVLMVVVSHIFCFWWVDPCHSICILALHVSSYSSLVVKDRPTSEVKEVCILRDDPWDQRLSVYKLRLWHSYLLGLNCIFLVILLLLYISHIILMPI